VENACLAHAWNAGQRVSYWREEPLDVDAVIEGSWGSWAVEVRTGAFVMHELRGLRELTARLPDLQPLVSCDAPHHAMVERGGGSLIFTSTFVGHTVGFPGMAAYAASKAGLLGLTQVLAAEYGPQGIRVNALLPGGTDTPMGRLVADTPEKQDFVAGLHALKRIAAPEEIARSALYLASEAGSFTTGTAMLVDGGVSVLRA